LKYNVLVFPGGTEIGLEIQKGLSQCKDIRLYSAGLNVSNHAPYVFARHFVIPSIYDPTWIDSLNKIITNHGIDYVFPAYDDVIVALAQNTEMIKARIVSSPLQTCLITRSKSKTYHLLANVVPIPELYDDLEAIDQYPVFVKPDEGQGSQHTKIIRSRGQLSQLLGEDREYIVMEYLPNEEYTVDCFSDRDAGLLFCGGRQRIRTRSGISMNSKPVQDDMFVEYANPISEKLTFYGGLVFPVEEGLGWGL
jgi:carbamoylphosphate synthase large subunit